jgi:hypothetical protein
MISSANTWAANHFRKQSALLDGLAEDRRDDRVLQQAKLELSVKRSRADVHASVAGARR